MTNIALAIFLILFGTLELVPTKVPDWIVPVAAVIAGLVVLAGGGWWKKPS